MQDIERGFTEDEVKQLLECCDLDFDEFTITSDEPMLSLDDLIKLQNEGKEILLTPCAYIADSDFIESFAMQVVSTEHQGELVKLDFIDLTNVSIYCNKNVVPSCYCDVFKFKFIEGKGVVLDLDMSLFKKEYLLESYTDGKFIVNKTDGTGVKLSCGVLNDRHHLKDRLMQALEDNCIVAVRLENDTIVQMTRLTILQIPKNRYVH